MKVPKILSFFIAFTSFSVLAEEPIPKIFSDSFTRALEHVEISDSLGDSSNNLTTISAVATGITYYEVFAVASPLYGNWELIGDYQSSTVHDHGGGFIDVAVLQIGYGNETGGRMNGFSGTIYDSEYLCGSSVSTLHYCSAGETITAWLYYYEFSNSTGGLFDSSASSVAVPFGTSSDTLSIR